MFKRYRQRRANKTAERVIALWNDNNGWLPGAAYRELAEALGVDPSRLTHWDWDMTKRVEGRG